ncbi:MAG: hypothetical protein LUG27_05380 [Clostridiales bacterium]|nr:hypothetical protein [Clostridiales bacterium]
MANTVREWTDDEIYEKLEDIMTDRLDKGEADGTGRNLAWELGDGRFLMLQACGIGYSAYVLGGDYRDEGGASCAVVFCWAEDYPDEALLEHAAGSINENGKFDGVKPVGAAGARPVDYFEVARKRDEAYGGGFEPEAA